MKLVVKNMTTSGKRAQKPDWLKKSLPKGSDYQKLKNLLSGSKLKTVCQEAKCPNIFECFSRNTSTFMILGNQCTRKCRFCNVISGTPLPPDPEEPQRVVHAVSELKLQYVVITSVTRDDLEDGGASQFVKTIKAIRNKFKDKVKIEVLIPDFQGDLHALESVVTALPDVVNHNIETVESLYQLVRPGADYKQSLQILKNVKQINPSVNVKSGLMTGLGENIMALEKTMQDIHEHGCDILTIGQYLQPSDQHLPVDRYYTPEEFKQLEKMALKTGFKNVAIAPLVRSSYKASKLFMQ